MRLQNGFGKLAHYFDLDNSGVVKGKELKQLKIWIDINGDAKTDPGELVPLSAHGITEIVIPGHHKMDSTMKTQSLEKFNVESEGGATLSGYDFEPKRDLYDVQMDLTKSTSVEQETQATVAPTNLPKELRKVEVKAKVRTTIQHGIKDMSRRSEILVDLGAKHGLATTQYLKNQKVLEYRQHPNEWSRGKAMAW